MAVATYDTDLTDINDDTDTSTWTEMTDMAGQGSITEDEQDFPIQGTYHAAQICTKAATLGSACFDNSANLYSSFGTYDCFFLWQTFLPAAACDTFANGGLRAVIGTSSGVWSAWKTGGKDFGRYPYGGWQNTVIWPSFTADYSYGGGFGVDWQLFGSAVNVVRGIGKGVPHGIDIMRYGRGELYVELGDTGVGTFTGMAAANDVSTARWGLFQAVAGGYLWKGLMSLGTVSNAVIFTAENVNITVDNCLRTFADFSKIEINHADSVINWTNVNISALIDATYGSLAVGAFEMIANATVNDTGGVFTDMGAFTYQSNATLIGRTFRRCGLITTGGATLTDCVIDESTDATKAMIVSSPANAALVSGAVFNSAGTGHGLEIGGTAANFTLTDCTFTGYDQADPGTAANKAIFVNIATGTMSITISGGSGVAEDYHVRSAGATVTVNADTTITFTGLKDNSEVRIYKVSDDSVVAGIEDATDGSPDARTFAWSAPATTEVYYRIICFEPSDEIYEPIEVESYTVPSTDTSIDIVQRIDRNAEN